ncbi:craniofacial development protein 2-like [Elysia marginata]|uniref:Craniofacial development protein 2-like n=1 Tax=Elysia marginata TaxID=1093978 RepID=A0AAV4J2V3_9GAST|nr:craniofacial development protein 2-like [Elysia marginata]
MMLKKQIAKCAMGVWSVSLRKILRKLKAEPFNISAVETHSPTTDFPGEDLEAYFEELQTILKDIEVLIIMGNFNAKTGNIKDEDVVSSFCIG